MKNYECRYLLQRQINSRLDVLRELKLPQGCCTVSETAAGIVGEKRGGAPCRVKIHRLKPDLRYGLAAEVSV